MHCILQCRLRNRHGVLGPLATGGGFEVPFGVERALYHVDRCVLMLRKPVPEGVRNKITERILTETKAKNIDEIRATYYKA